MGGIVRSVVRLEPGLVVRGDVVERLSESGRCSPASIRDGLSQQAVAGTHLDRVEHRRLAEEVPHLLKLPSDEPAEHGMTRGGGPEVGVNLVVPGGIESPIG